MITPTMGTCLWLRPIEQPTKGPVDRNQFPAAVGPTQATEGESHLQCVNEAVEEIDMISLRLRRLIKVCALLCSCQVAT